MGVRQVASLALGGMAHVAMPAALAQEVFLVEKCSMLVLSLSCHRNEKVTKVLLFLACSGARDSALAAVIEGGEARPARAASGS